MHFFALALLLVLLAGCSQNDPPQPFELLSTDQTKTVIPDSLITALGRHSMQTAKSFVAEAKILHSLTNEYLALPNENNQIRVQRQWLTTHIAYTTAQLGLIGGDQQDLNFADLGFRLDAWPIQPGFIDNVPEYPHSGVVFDKTLEINTENLLEQHGVTDDEEVLLGFHSIEFLVFSRPASDYLSQTSEWNDRRRLMLELIIKQFLTDSISFSESVESYYSERPSNSSTAKIFLRDALAKARLASRESNLVAAQNTGHCLDATRSIAVLAAEIHALDQFFITAVPLGTVLRSSSPVAYENFVATLEQTKSAIQSSENDEVARANLPLLLSALTHQLETFYQSI